MGKGKGRGTDENATGQGDKEKEREKDGEMERGGRVDEWTRDESSLEAARKREQHENIGSGKKGDEFGVESSWWSGNGSEA